MMRKKGILLLGISAFIILAIFLYKSIKIKENVLFSVASQVLANKQDFWFSYEKTDSLYDSSRFHYFFFVKKRKTLVDKDSTLFILNQEAYPADSILTGIKDKLYLPLSAFPFIMKEEDDFVLCRIDSVEKNNGRTKFKLHKIDS